MTPRRVEAGYLPGMAAHEVDWHLLPFERGAARLDVAVPRLTAGQARALAARVRGAAARHLRPMAVADIIAVIDRAMARLLDRDDPYRQQAEALLPLVSGYDADMVRLGLTGLFKTFRAPQLRRFVAEDFANPGVLDGFQPAPKGGAVRAFGPDLLLHSWAGNVPALALWSLVCGLLAKSGSIGKLASAEPLFAGWFARLLAEVHPPWADCLAVVWWSGAGEDGSGCADALYAQADTVIAYGGNTALDAIRQRLPVTTRFVPHGHRLGLGLVAAEALDSAKAPALARLAAWDVMRYDQQGCYSPHAFYVERGGAVSPRAFADYLAAELANLQRRFPRAELGLEEAAAVARWRQGVEWQALSEPSAGGVLLSGPSAQWAVAYADGARPLAPTALQRTIQVVGVDRLDDVPPAIAGQGRFLQTAGVAASPEALYRLAAALGSAGVTRVCAIGAMSTPEAGWHNDGRFNLLDLVRMVEIEQSAELAAEPLAPYAD